MIKHRRKGRELTETALLPEWTVALALQETAQLGPIGVLKAPNALFLHAGAIRLLPIFQELLELIKGKISVVRGNEWNEVPLIYSYVQYNID